ncbi:MAG: 2,4-dihydroxyhept-2-ene-1,7-dioic acid aldolase [Alphaproteobacteria bacterium]|nr:2,4-dihydroxyhept-2-ene-1,7-dioic acid aldolase [Alphaproteobacteria bacterium]
MSSIRVRQIWQQGGAVVNGWLAIPSPFAAELMGRAGFDSLVIDMQHGVQDYASLVPILQALDACPVTAMVRVPWNEPGIIGKCLDAGAKGIICPMVNSAAEAEALVQSCRYPPRGSRSFGPIRAGMGRPTYWKEANDEVIVMPMIETAQAVANIEAICAVPGIDAFYVGPADLALSLGCPPKGDADDPKVLAAFDTVLAAAKRAGIQVGLHNATPEGALRQIARGFTFATIANDASFLSARAIEVTGAMRKGLGQAAASGAARPGY